MRHDEFVTAQISDTVKSAGEELQIAGISSPPLFEPSAYGLKPSTIGSACWRGYVCGFVVEGGQLRLQRLLLGRKSKVGERELTVGDELLGGAVGEATKSWERGCLLLDGLDYPVSYTGGLLVGDGFVSATYVHMGFHPAWKFERVVELIFEAGNLTDRIDRSEEMRALRERIAAGEQSDPDGKRGSRKWIERTFSLDYQRSPS